MRAFILVLAALLASPSARAQPAGEPAASPAPRPDFAALDRNKDGYLSKYEAAADREIGKRFASFDADGDGRLSEAEYVAAKQDNERRVLRDAALTAKVKAALFAEKGIPSLAISVDSYEGQVQLSGLVPAAEIASHAGRVTAGVSGVRTVHNNLAVR